MGGPRARCRLYQHAQPPKQSTSVIPMLSRAWDERTHRAGPAGVLRRKQTLVQGFPRLHLTYVGCPERAPPPGIRSRTIYPDAHVASTWFLNILLYVDKCEESRVTMRTVPNAIIIDDTQPRTPNQSFISLRLRRAVRPPVLSDRTKRDGRSSSWRKSFSPCLCRPVLRLTEGPE